ncbi:5-methylcytosine restriction system specificity protein McrC [Sphingobacterium faecium]
MKWKDILLQKFADTSYYRLDCEKLSEEVSCFKLKRNNDQLEIETSYFIGLDYIGRDLPLLVEPKFSYGSEDYSIDFYKILFESLPYIKTNEIISDLYYVNFDAATIEIEQKDDFLTPILVIQYLNLLRKICLNGLQKGYYKVEENLSGKVKGKILIKETLKNNHLKADYSKTFCNYQEFGFNTEENQFLKYALQFCMNYLNRFKQLDLFQNLESTVGIIRSSMQKVDLNNTFGKPVLVRKNLLYPSYEEAIKLANMILKRTAFNITNTTKNKVKTFPYWINMSKLFELHVVRLLRKSYPQGVHFQKEFGGRIPDIVLNTENFKAVIDVKYKDYSSKPLEIEDIRQVAAYSKMKGIFKELKLDKDRILDAIVIYPKVGSQNNIIDDSTFQSRFELTDYYNIFKLEVDIPIINKTN